MHYTLLNVRHCVAHCVLGEALRTVATQISSALVVSMAAAPSTLRQRRGAMLRSYGGDRMNSSGPTATWCGRGGGWE